jgi:hypothetical protein
VGGIPELAPLQLGSLLQLITVQLQLLLMLLLLFFIIMSSLFLRPGRAPHPQHILHTEHRASQLCA